MTEREAIESAIRYCDGSVPQAATLLEISASTLYRKIKEWQQLDAATTSDERTRSDK
jgi:DNA-binding NtrC family response regulator